jgi:hypothetical protein
LLDTQDHPLAVDGLQGEPDGFRDAKAGGVRWENPDARPEDQNVDLPPTAKRFSPTVIPLTADTPLMLPIVFRPR